MTLRNPPEHTDSHPQGGFGAPIRPEPKTPTPPPLRQPQPGAIPVDIADLGMILRDGAVAKAVDTSFSAFETAFFDVVCGGVGAVKMWVGEMAVDGDGNIYAERVSLASAWPAYSADYQAGYRDGYAAAQKRNPAPMLSGNWTMCTYKPEDDSAAQTVRALHAQQAADAIKLRDLDAVREEYQAGINRLGELARVITDDGTLD